MPWITALNFNLSTVQPGRSVKFCIKLGFSFEKLSMWRTIQIILCSRDVGCMPPILISVERIFYSVYLRFMHRSKNTKKLVSLLPSIRIDRWKRNFGTCSWRTRQIDRGINDTFHVSEVHPQMVASRKITARPWTARTWFHYERSARLHLRHRSARDRSAFREHAQFRADDSIWLKMSCTKLKSISPVFPRRVSLAASLFFRKAGSADYVLTAADATRWPFDM